MGRTFLPKMLQKLWEMLSWQPILPRIIFKKYIDLFGTDEPIIKLDPTTGVLFLSAFWGLSLGGPSSRHPLSPALNGKWNFYPAPHKLEDMIKQNNFLGGM